MNSNRTTALVMVMLAAILAAAVQSGRPPSPLPASADPARFSAARALDVLRTILAGGAPHPLGSAAHDVVRDRIVERFRTLGYSPTLQQTFACNAHATCAPVANILARLPGDPRADTLAVVAHYDSVAAGAGASDDGIGVATVLEVARALRAARFRNSVLFLITDGEEAGLLGAEGFVADRALSRGVAAAINIDDRGTSGRSVLFETSRENRWLVRIAANALPGPVANSLDSSVYELLPNDTDLSVFKRADLAGVNFACVGGVAHYHTPLDDLRNVTPATVQDHGNHVLAMTRALANADLRQSSTGDAVFFDVFSLSMVWWPEGWTPWMAGGALLLLFLSAAIRMRKGQTTPGHITAGVFSWFLTIVASAVIGGAAAWIVSLRTPSAVWSAQPGPSIAAMWLIGAATAMICAKPFYARAGFDGLFFGHGLCWCAASFGAVVMLPGGSDLVVVPAIVFALAAALRATLALSPARAVVLTSAAAAVLWFPVIIRLYEIMGRPTLGLIAVTVAIVSTTFTPVAVSAGIRRAAVTAMYGTAAACIAMQLLIPVYTPDSPERIDVRYVDTEEGARWVVDHLTPAIRSHGPFRHVPPAWAPWLAQPAGGWAAPSPRVSAAPPELRVLRDDRGGRRQVTLLVRSMRGANAIALFFRAPELAGLSINGIAPPPPPQRFRSRLAPGWHAVNVIGQSAAQIEITLRRDEPIEVVVADHSRTLPPEAAPLLRARDRSIAVPSGEGDGMTVERRLVLK